MLHSFSRARAFANAFTFVLAFYAAWGWLTDPQLPVADRLGSAAMAFLVQQLANVAAACAGVAAARKQYICVAGALLLMLMFAGAAGHSIDHTMNRPSAAREAAAASARNEERARLLAEIRAVADQRAGAQAALLAIPSDIPTRRIQALQAPLDEVIARSDARIAALEATRSALDTPITSEPNPNKTALSIIFWALAFAEPGIYWLFAALGDPATVPAVPVPRPTRDRDAPGTPGSGHPNSSRSLFGRVAVAIGLTASPVAHAGDAGDAVSQVAASRDGEGTMNFSTSGAAAASVGRRSEPDAALIAAILDLDRQGFSLRRIVSILGRSSKSAVHRIVQRERAANLQAEPRAERP